jgi:hypothetical protein
MIKVKTIKKPGNFYKIEFKIYNRQIMYYIISDRLLQVLEMDYFLFLTYSIVTQNLMEINEITFYIQISENHLKL